MMKLWQSLKKSVLGIALAITVMICADPVVGVVNPTGPGQLRAWGEDNTGWDISYPVIAPPGNHIAVDGGIAVQEDGSLLCFYPALAQGEYVPVPTGTFTDVGDGEGGHAVAIRTDGSLVSWGRESHGQISDTPTTGSYVQVDTGDSHQIALRDDGSIVCWGADYYNQCSDQPTTGVFTKITTTTHFNIGIKDDGSLVSWGGQDSHGAVSDTPTDGFYIDAACGYWFGLAIRDDDQNGEGSIVGWGYLNGYNFPSGDDFVAIASNMWWAVALRSDGTLIQWGRNEFSPIQIGAIPPSDTDHVAIATGFTFGVALALPCPDSDNDLICNADDNCPSNYNPGQLDSDGDGVGNACDAPNNPGNGCPQDDDGGLNSPTFPDCPGAGIE